MINQFSSRATAVFDVDDPTLYAVTWAFYRSLQTEGVIEDIGKIQGHLENFAFNKMSRPCGGERHRYAVTDFHKCEMITRLRHIGNKIVTRDVM